MPILEIKKLSENRLLAVWNITETLEQLSETLRLNDDEMAV